MIAIIDCNNFYVSCERLFQPMLKDRAVIVLSNNDGCVISRSEEAKALGIAMGTPAFQIQDFLSEHNVAIFSSNYTLYGSLSERVMHTLKRYCSTVEVYSIDEAFLYLTDMYVDNLERYANEIREAVQAVGIPVTVGIAATKTLAKMANRYAKKHKKGVYVLDTPDKTSTVLDFTSVGDIWGIGPQYSKLLLRHGFNTAKDLAKAPQEWIRKNLSVVGQRLLNELNGIPCIEMAEELKPKKSICVARSFGQLLSDYESVNEALANYAVIAVSKLRQQNSCARSLSVFVQTNAFRVKDSQYHHSIIIQFPVATNSTTEVLKYAGKALHIIWKAGYNYKKVGILLADLVPEDQVQQAIFDRVGSRNREQQLMKAVDAINKAFRGKEVVKFATQGHAKKWKLRQERLSPCYTTRLSDILTINV